MQIEDVQFVEVVKQKPLIPAVCGLALLAHLAIFGPLPLSWQAGAVLILTGLLPGLLFVEWLLGGRAGCLPEPWERSLYVLGAGYAIMVVVMLALCYVPGPITWWHTLAAFDLILALLIALLWRRQTFYPDLSASASEREAAAWPPILPGDHANHGYRGWLLAGLISLALVGGFMRFPNLSYSEFQGDEARVLLSTVDAIQGYNASMFNHKKGPAEILIPADIYTLTNRLNEAMARLPFAIANFAGLFAVFLLGWRLFNPVAGWSAAMLLALDGYFIGFSRIVQYQSIVFLMVVLVVLVLYRLVHRPAALTQYLTLAAIFLATGLLAHYEAALVVLPAVYLLYVLWRRGTNLGRLARALLAPVITGAVLLAAFYVPFVLDPSFESTYGYITVNRIGTTFPYNNLVDFFERTTLYSPSYYFLLITACAGISLIVIYRRGLPGWAGWGVATVFGAGLLFTLFRPSWIFFAGDDQTWAFFAAALLIAWFMPNFPIEERMIWLWFGVPMVFMLFFTLTPNTHVYGFFVPWLLIAGMVVARGWQGLSARFGVRTAAPGGDLPCAGVARGVRQLRILVFCRHQPGGVAQLADKPAIRVLDYLRYAHPFLNLRLSVKKRLENGRRPLCRRRARRAIRS